MSLPKASFAHTDVNTCCTLQLWCSCNARVHAHRERLQTATRSRCCFSHLCRALGTLSTLRKLRHLSVQGYIGDIEVTMGKDLVPVEVEEL